MRALTTGWLCVVGCLAIAASAQAAPPQCLNGTASGTPQDTPLLLPPAPCSDPDGDPLTIIIVSGPTHGTLSAPDAQGRRTYTPASGYTGQDFIQFKANDGTSDSNVATLTIDVSPSTSGSPPAGTPTGGTPPAQAGPAAPVPGKTGNASVVSGTVLVRVPGSSRFVALTSATKIPVGSQIDTRHGTVKLVVALRVSGATASAQLSGGRFRFTQPLSGAGTLRTDLTLVGGSFATCPARGRAGRARRRTIRYLKAQATGKFNVIGKNSAGLERGTTWTTTDTCAGTLTRVLSGSVAVRDFAKRKTIIVAAGRSYLAVRPT